MLTGVSYSSDSFFHLTSTYNDLAHHVWDKLALS